MCVFQFRDNNIFLIFCNHATKMVVSINMWKYWQAYQHLIENTTWYGTFVCLDLGCCVLKRLQKHFIYHLIGFREKEEMFNQGIDRSEYTVLRLLLVVKQNTINYFFIFNHVLMILRKIFHIILQYFHQNPKTVIGKIFFFWNVVWITKRWFENVW